MAKTYHLFLDESSHLENDKSPVMVIGFIKVPGDRYKELKDQLKHIKFKHGIPHEFKWNTTSNTKIEFYEELINFFFGSSISFRSVIVKYKQNLDHEQFNKGSHDNFYYKMIYFLLNNPYFNSPEDDYRVFLDIKDTRGREKLAKINEIFQSQHHGTSPFKHFQHIRSHESVFIQLADLFIGAIGYKAKGLNNSKGANYAKNHIIELLEKYSGYNIDEGTEPWEKKFNIFDHQPRKRG